ASVFFSEYTYNQAAVASVICIEAEVETDGIIQIEKHDEHETKGKFSNGFPKNSINLKYEDISVPQGSVDSVKKTQERKSSTCYLLITKVLRVRAQEVPLKRPVAKGRGATLNL
ncbi:hypothetical protein TNCV_3284231, partial [Trichonephila clavipes]